MTSNPGGPGQARYLAGPTGGLAVLSQPLRRQGGQVGVGRAERWVAVSDGGAGIEDFLRRNVPRVEAAIRDFYHAAKHRHGWAGAWHPEDPAAAAARAGAWCRRLKPEGGAAVLAELAGLDLRGRPAAVRAARRDLPGYFTDRRHRMDDPHYRRRGWPIGSGPAESACERVVGQRLKGSGMRRGEGGADAVGHLRALFRSEARQWDAFWATAA